MHHAIRQRKFANLRSLRGVEPSLVNGTQNARDAAVIGVEHCGAHAAFALVAVRIIVGEAVEQLSIGENRIKHGGGIPAQGVCGHGGDAVEDFHAAQPAEGAHQFRRVQRPGGMRQHSASATRADAVNCLLRRAVWIPAISNIRRNAQTQQMHRLCRQEEIQLGAGNEHQPGGNFIGGGARHLAMVGDGENVVIQCAIGSHDILGGQATVAASGGSGNCI